MSKKMVSNVTQHGVYDGRLKKILTKRAQVKNKTFLERRGSHSRCVGIDGFIYIGVSPFNQLASHANGPGT